MTMRKHKEGQVAIFLVLILAGLTLLFALNIDIFTSSRSKIRLQNAADASALALARWQGTTLNMVGDLNIAHLAAICQSNVNAISGVVQLQSRLAFIGPTIGFKAANEIAEKNGAQISEDMTLATRLVSEFMDEGYRRMLDVVIRDGIRAGVDNAAIHKPFPIKDFFEAIQQRNYKWFCRFNGYKHRLPEVPAELLNPDELMISGPNACFGSLGVQWENGDFYSSSIESFVDLADDYGIDDTYINRYALSSNANLFAEHQWCVYNRSEWRDLPYDFSYSRFPWLTPLREEYNVCGGSATIRVEGLVSLASISAQTNFIAAQAAANALGQINGRKVTSVTPSIILPSFARVRLFPFGVGAVDRYGLADIDHVRGLLGFFSKPGSDKSYLYLLEVYRSEEFQKAAELWYSQHAHGEVCCPSGDGAEHGGGTPHGN